MNRLRTWPTYLQVAPLALVFLLFLVVPIATIVVVSFWDYNTTSIIPAFLIQNYEELRRFYSAAAQSGDAMLLFIS